MKSTTNLAYAWTVSINGMVQTSLTSESLDTSRFRLSAYRLTPLKTYDILVTVTNTLSGNSSTASVGVAVQQGAVVAHVSGNDARSILADGSLTLDASSSLDQDVACHTHRRSCRTLIRLVMRSVGSRAEQHLPADSQRHQSANAYADRPPAQPSVLSPALL